MTEVFLASLPIQKCKLQFSDCIHSILILSFEHNLNSLELRQLDQKDH